MKEFKLNLLKKLILATSFLFVMSLSVSAQSTQTWLDKLEGEKAKLENMRESYISQSGKYANFTDVINYVQSAIYFVNANGELPPNFRQNDVWKKISTTVLKNYTASELSQMQAAMSRLDETSPQYSKLSLVLAANQ